MAVTITEVFAPTHAYRVNNGVYTVDIGIERFRILSLTRLDALGVALIDDFPEQLGKGHPQLFYQTEVSPQIQTRWVLPTNDAWTTTYTVVGSDVWVQGVAHYADVEVNHIALTISYIIADAVDYVGVQADITCNHKIAWAVYRDLYHADGTAQQLGFSRLGKIDDFGTYLVDADVQTAWNHPTLIELASRGIADQGLSTAKCAKVYIRDGETTLIRQVLSSDDLRKDQGNGVTDVASAGLYFCTALDRYPTKAPDEFPVPSLRIIAEILEVGATADDDGAWVEVGRLDYLARPSDALWYSHFMPWPTGIDLISVEGIRFRFDADDDCVVFLDEVRFVLYDLAVLYANKTLQLGRPWPLNTAWYNTTDFFLFVYENLVPFDALGVVGRWESASGLRVEYDTDSDSYWVGLESTLLRNQSDYTYTASWEIHTYHSAGDERWDFFQDLQDRQTALAAINSSNPTGLTTTEIWPEKQGLASFEMDGLQNVNETVHSQVQLMEQLRKADYYNVRQLGLRTDSFGSSLTKLRIGGAMEWQTPLLTRHLDYFDAATRYFRQFAEKQVWAVLDADQNYFHLFQSQAEVARTYDGSRPATLIFVWLSERGARIYEERDLPDAIDYDFGGSYQTDAQGIRYYPEKVLLFTHPSLAGLDGDASIWGTQQTLRSRYNQFVEEWAYNQSHEHSGLILRLPAFRNGSFNPEDLTLYNAWRVANAKSAYLATDTFTSTDQDTYIFEGLPSTNYGGSGVLWVGFDGSGNSYHGLVQFDVSSVPVYHQITQATLRLYVSASDGIDLEIQAWSCGNNWDEMQATWDDRLTATAWDTVGGDFLKMPGGTQVVSGDVGSWVEIDVTEIVRSWTEGSLTNSGLLLKPLYVMATTYPARVSFDTTETPGNTPQLVITHGDFAKLNNAAVVSSANPYIRDDQDLWDWRTSVIEALIAAWDNNVKIIPVINSDFFTEADYIITGYGNTNWVGVDYSYLRDLLLSYPRTILLPDSWVKRSGQWGLNFQNLTTSYFGISMKPPTSRYTYRLAHALDLYEVVNVTPEIIIDLGIFTETLSPPYRLRPRDIEELLRITRSYEHRWMVTGWEHWTALNDNEMTFWGAVSQAQNDFGNTWEREEWTSPEAFNLNFSPQGEQSTSVNLRHSVLMQDRDEARHSLLSTVQMVFPVLGLESMGFLQKLLQFGKVIQWDVENKYDVSLEIAFRLAHSSGETRFYGTHRSWRSGTVRVYLDGVESVGNDATYPFVVCHEEGYVLFYETVPAPEVVVTLAYQSRMTLLAHSIVPADTAELKNRERESKFLPTQVIFKEVR